MGASVYNARNDAREARKRDVLEAGLMAGRFPDVESIVVTMNYRREKVSSSILRTLHFNPGSPAFFKVSCLGEGCESGGLDLTAVIDTMVRGHRKSGKGQLTCENRDPGAVHAAVDYNVTITYV